MEDYKLTGHELQASLPVVQGLWDKPNPVQREIKPILDQVKNILNRLKREIHYEYMSNVIRDEKGNYLLLDGTIAKGNEEYSDYMYNVDFEFLPPIYYNYMDIKNPINIPRISENLPIVLEDGSTVTIREAVDLSELNPYEKGMVHKYLWK